MVFQVSCTDCSAQFKNQFNCEICDKSFANANCEGAVTWCHKWSNHRAYAFLYKQNDDKIILQIKRCLFDNGVKKQNSGVLKINSFAVRMK